MRPSWWVLVLSHKFEPDICDIKKDTNMTFYEELEKVNNELCAVSNKYKGYNSNTLYNIKLKHDESQIWYSTTERVMKLFDKLHHYGAKLIFIATFIRYVTCTTPTIVAIIQKYPDEVDWLYAKQIINLSATNDVRQKSPVEPNSHDNKKDMVTFYDILAKMLCELRCYYARRGYDNHMSENHELYDAKVEIDKEYGYKSITERMMILLDKCKNVDDRKVLIATAANCPAYVHTINEIVKKYPSDINALVKMGLMEKYAVKTTDDKYLFIKDETACANMNSINSFMKMTNKLSFANFIKVLKLSTMSDCDKVECIKRTVNDCNDVEDYIKDFSGIEKLYHDETLTLTDNAIVAYSRDLLAKIINYTQ